MGIKISHSAAARFKQCPQKYYYSLKYRSKKKGSALPFGLAIEDGVTQLLVTDSLEEAISKFYLSWENEGGDSRKPVFDNPDVEYNVSDFDKSLIQSDIDFVKDNFKELVSDQYDTWEEAFTDAKEKVKAEEEISENLLTFMNRVYWWSCRLRGRYMLESFYKDIYPYIDHVINLNDQPAAQYKIEMNNEEGDTLEGYIDYIIQFKDREKPSIVDCKTAAYLYKEHDIETSDQLRIYTQGIKTKYDMDCDACYMVLGKRLKKTKYCEPCQEEYNTTKRKCDSCKEKLSTGFYGECQLLFTSYSEKALEDELDDYQNLLEAIDSGINYKNTNSCMAYGRPCEFYDLCWKNKKPKDVDHLFEKERKK